MPLWVWGRVEVLADSERAGKKSSLKAFAFDWDLIFTEMVLMFLMLLLSNFTFKFNDVLRKFLLAFRTEGNTPFSVL